MFLLENACRQTLNCVTVVHRYDTLRDNWSAIKCFVNKVNCASARLHSGFESLTLRIETRKRRQQARMNVQDASAKSLDEFARKNAHVAGETNEIDFAIFQRRSDVTIVFLTLAPAMFEHERFNFAFLGFRQPRRARLIADDDGDLGVWDATFANRIRQCDHVRAAA